MFVLDDILLAPIKGIAFIAQKIAEQVELEENDETTIQKQLLEVQLLYEMDEISEEDYEARSAGLLKKLRAARERDNI